MSIGLIRKKLCVLSVGVEILREIVVQSQNIYKGLGNDILWPFISECNSVLVFSSYNPDHEWIEFVTAEIACYSKHLSKAEKSVDVCSRRLYK